MTIELAYGDKVAELLLPDEWMEMNHEQLRCAHVCLVARSEKAVLDMLLACVVNDKKQARYVLKKLDVAELSTVVESMSWLKETPLHAKSSVRGNWLLRGLADGMLNMTWKQHGLLQETLNRYGAAISASKPDEANDAVDSMIALAYRPFSLPFSDWMVDVYKHILPKFFSKQKKMLVLSNITGMSDWLRLVYPESFARDGDEGEDKATSFGFRGLSVALAGGKFGTYYQLQKAMLHDVMVDLEKNALEVKKMEKKTS